MKLKRKVGKGLVQLSFIERQEMWWHGSCSVARHLGVVLSWGLWTEVTGNWPCVLFSIVWFCHCTINCIIQLLLPILFRNSLIRVNQLPSASTLFQLDLSNCLSTNCLSATPAIYKDHSWAVLMRLGGDYWIDWAFGPMQLLTNAFCANDGRGKWITGCLLGCWSLLNGNHGSRPSPSPLYQTGAVLSVHTSERVAGSST